MIRKYINKLITFFGYVLLKKTEIELIQNLNQTVSSILNYYTTYIGKPVPASAEIIVFSKDRPLQLHALLGSYIDNVMNRAPVSVIYSAASGPSRNGYEDVIASFGTYAVTGIHQNSSSTFREQLIEKLETVHSEKIIFLVDDILFIEKLDLNDFIKFDTRVSVPTLRMGANLTRAYTVDREQALPSFIPGAINDTDKICWKWMDGRYDWGYPLSVDGHLFSTKEILLLAKSFTFNSPNTFEAGLQRYIDLFKHRLGICYKKSRIINIPINKVQDDFENIHGSVHQDFLLEQWDKGMQMDYRKIYGINNTSAHQEVEISFIKRNGL